MTLAFQLCLQLGCLDPKLNRAGVGADGLGYNSLGVARGLQPDSLQPDVLGLGTLLSAFEDDVARRLQAPVLLFQASRCDPRGS